MRTLISISGFDVKVEVDGPEVEAAFGGTPAGGPVDFDFPADSTQIRSALADRAVRYCQENALPVPDKAQVIVLGA